MTKSIANLEARIRLAPDGVSLAQEWTYLVAETLSGEQVIVPLLQELLDDGLPRGLATTLQRQVDEELEHVRLYETLLGADASVASSVEGFAAKFAAFVRGLDSRTLKLFALQAMLEGLSLGAIAYRLRNLSSPHAALDERIYVEEEGHTRFGLAHLGELIRDDGLVQRGDFDRITRETNAIFRTSVTGETVSSFMEKNFNIKISSSSIENSGGMRDARRHGARIIVGTKAQFLSRYEAAVKRA